MPKLPFSLRIFSPLFVLILLATSLVSPPPSQARPQGALNLVKIVAVGGIPKAITVDNYAGRNDVLFYDAATSRIRFLDGETLALAPETIYMPNAGFEYWLVYDHAYHRTYCPTMEITTNNYGQAYYEVTINVIANRQPAGAISVNTLYNQAVAEPPDTRFGMDGITFKQPVSEGDNPGRLIIDNTPLGNLDVIDIQASGDDAILRQRYSYRAPTTTTGWYDNRGNSLALETRHETLSQDDLADADVVYIADPNDAISGIQRVQIDHYPGSLSATTLAPLDFAHIFPFSEFVQGLELAAIRDRLYVSTNAQSFDTGYIGLVNSTNQAMEIIETTYQDPGFVHVDWYDPSRMFTTGFDGFYNDPTQSLYLKLYDGSTLIDTLPLFSNWGEYDGPHGMAFDPYNRRLYITVNGYIVVVQVDYGAAPAPPAPVTATTLISPSGGELEVPGGRATITFPDGTFDQPVQVTYREDLIAPPSALFQVQAFDLSAVISGTTTPVTTLNNPITIAVPFSDLNAGPTYEQTLGLYSWDGASWIKEPSTVNYFSQQVLGYPDHLSFFAILGQTERLYLPLTQK